MNLKETLEAIKDAKLNLQQLEAFHEQLTHFKSDLALQIAEFKKKRALYLLSSPESTATAKKMAWEGTEEGQRLITLQGYWNAVPSELSSLKNRIYAHLPRL